MTDPAAAAAFELAMRDMPTRREWMRRALAEIDKRILAGHTGLRDAAASLRRSLEPERDYLEDRP